AELPELSITQSYSETVSSGSYRTPMDSGPGKTRPRPDAPNRTIPFEQLLTDAQLVAFEAFYVVELSNGALSFVEFSPRTGISTTYRFFEGFTHVYAGGYWRTRFVLEVVS
ncbi:MAG: hypothetical protein OEQ18_14550, partial [Gammaproteobacteria bacterium]|nr:hypothetical protein [Gammaproteobacteria bacterium]